MGEFFGFLIVFFLSPLVLPIILLVGIAIFIIDGRPIFYREIRVGRFGCPFKIYKFRTMKECKKGIILTEKNRGLLTKTGGFLRRFGLDELPQFLNILRGEMTLVGPRPLPEEHPVNRVGRGRLKVKPGITGLAQINGRNRISWDEKLKFDLEYVKNRGIFTDLLIIIRTPFSLGRDMFEIGEKRES